MDIKILKLYAINNLKKLSFKDLIIFLIPVIVFSFYLYVYDPGIVRFDSFYQINQIATSNFNNWHPFFHTFIEIICLKIYPNAKSIAILQIGLFSLIWMVICNYFRNPSLNNEINKEFILQVVLTVIIVLIPMNAIFSISLIKDTLFSYMILLSCFLLKLLLDKKGNVNLPFIIIFSLVLACIAQLRYNGFYLVIVLIIFLAIYIFWKYKNHRLAIAIPALTVIFILLFASLNVIYDVEDNHKDAFAAKLGHMLADYELNLDISKEDKQLVDKLFKEDVKDKYENTFMDPISKIINKTEYNKNKFTYISLGIKYSLNNPIYFLNYMFKTSPLVWDIVRDDDWRGGINPTHTDSARDRFYSENPGPYSNGFENSTSKNKNTDMYKELDKFVLDISDNNIITSTLLYSPALYMYLAIILMCAIYVLTRSKDIFISYLPNLLNILTVFVSIPFQDNRYLYPNLLLVYFLLIILISIINKPKENNDLNNPDELSQKELEKQI